MKKLLSALLAFTMVLSVIVITPPIEASAAIGDGDKLSVDINLEAGHYVASTDTFTPLKAGETLNAGSTITVRICPKNDFYAGVTRYVVMFSKSYLQIVGSGTKAFTPNYNNTFYKAVASGWSGASDIPSYAWPKTFGSTENSTVYSAVAVNNQADNTSGNGGHPGTLPGTWLFRFNLKVLKNITASSGVRIWMDKRWIRTATNTTGESFFVKCLKADELSSSGSSTTYNFKIDLNDANIKLPIAAAPSAPTLSASTKTITNKTVTVSIAYPSGATNKQYKLNSTGTWKTYTVPIVLSTNYTVYANYKNSAGMLSNTGSLAVTNIDKTAPSISALTVSKNGYTKKSVSVYVSDTNLSSKTVTKNGSTISWPSINLFSADGKYVITAKDKAGNSNQYIFTIDKTLPTITAKSAANNGYSKNNVTVTVSDTNYSSKSVTKNGKAMTWPSSNVFSSDGKYVITAKDKAGNIRNYTFTVDKTAPKITVKTLSGVILANNKSTKGGATFSIAETNLSSKVIKKNSKTITWPSSNKVTAVGTYTITVTDKVGYTATFTFKVT